ncbi:MAG: DNA replication/repair protein RecF [Proteobacteria bacterium]|nr:DNA replication/repair protein RecF [Pseudomonadota bacterium]
MELAHLRARRFRNLGDLRIEPGPGVCVLFGDNAQGKTNIVEAVHLLSNLQSFRTRRTRDLIGSGFPEALVEGDISGRNGTVRLQIQLDAGGRTARVDGKSPPSASSYLSEFHTVLFSPVDIDLARGSQDLRRRYVDRATFLRDPGHLARLRDYNRVLRQRNTCLRRGDGGLEVWDEQLADLGAAVHGARIGTVAELSPVIADLHRELSGGEAVEIACTAPYAQDQGGAEELRQSLRQGRERDTRLGYTSTGPHRDTVRLRLDGRPVERFGSQGQMRSLALSLKLALLSWGRTVLGEEPVFLLDDPGSELDSIRLRTLARFLEDWPGQVLIAGTERDAVPVPDPGNARYYRVTAGCAAAA